MINFVSSVVTKKNFVCSSPTLIEELFTPDMYTSDIQNQWFHSDSKCTVEAKLLSIIVSTDDKDITVTCDISLLTIGMLNYLNRYYKVIIQPTVSPATDIKFESSINVNGVYTEILNSEALRRETDLINCIKSLSLTVHNYENNKLVFAPAPDIEVPLDKLTCRARDSGTICIIHTRELPKVFNEGCFLELHDGFAYTTESYKELTYGEVFRELVKCTHDTAYVDNKEMVYYLSKSDNTFYLYTGVEANRKLLEKIVAMTLN